MSWTNPEGLRYLVDIRGSLLMSCDFCTEFELPSRSYEDRILAQTEFFVVVPTRGPLHDNNLLVCTRRHATGLHSLGPDEIAECDRLLASLRRRFDQLGSTNVLLFENGTTPGSVGGCSVTHFH